jgi:hypothetical protein
MKFADPDEIDRAWQLVQALRLAIQQHRIAMARARGGATGSEQTQSAGEPANCENGTESK